METYRQFPRSVSNIDTRLQEDDEDHEYSFSRILIQLEYLQNLFYVDRLLFNRHCHEEDLLGVSFQMATLTVHLWAQVDLYIKFKHEFEWIVSPPKDFQSISLIIQVMGFGAPAGGIL